MLVLGVGNQWVAEPRGVHGSVRSIFERTMNQTEVNGSQ